jgi:hypothetical protein
VKPALEKLYVRKDALIERDGEVLPPAVNFNNTRREPDATSGSSGFARAGPVEFRIRQSPGRSRARADLS